MEPFSVAMRDAQRHGILVGMTLPPGKEPVHEDVLSRLHPEERALAEELRGFRQVHWVGGRLAAAQAIRMLGRPAVPVLCTNEGAPVIEHGMAISISHKAHMAVALVARQSHGSVGVDLEDLSPPRPEIGRKVLTEEEMEAVAQLEESRQWTAIATRFTIKEAIYKALAPRLKRYIAFQEACVTPNLDGTAAVKMQLEPAGPPVDVEANFFWLDQCVLATVRARWGKQQAKKGETD